MRYHTRTVLDIETGAVIEDQVHEYSGPWALADRSIANQAANNSTTAGASAGGYGAAAKNIGGPLTAQLQQEAANPIGYTPEQTNAQLVAGEQGAGGANASITGQAGLAAGRTKNSAALSGVLDAAARAKTQQLSPKYRGKIPSPSRRIGSRVRLNEHKLPRNSRIRSAPRGQWV